MPMAPDAAQKYDGVLDELRSAEASFRYNMEHQIMNGYPIRIMDECQAKLRDAALLELPDAEQFPELHAYLSKIHDKRAEERERVRKLKEYQESPEGKKEKAMKDLEKIQEEIKRCAQEETHYKKQGELYMKKAEECQARSKLLYQQLTEAHIKFYCEFTGK